MDTDRGLTTSAESGIAARSSTVNTNMLTILLVVLGFLVSFVGWVAMRCFPGHMETIRLVTLIAAATVFGCVGAVQAKRKEVPFVVMLRGRMAVILGSVIALFWWGIAAFAIVRFVLGG